MILNILYDIPPDSNLLAIVAKTSMQVTKQILNILSKNK